MIEAMEQQIINAINGRWIKNKELRKEIDIDKVTDSFRVICSSRATILAIISEIKENNSEEELTNKLSSRIKEIYDWVTKENILTLIDKYENPKGRNNELIKDKKKIAEYREEIPCLKENLEFLEKNIIEITLQKLLLFYGIGVSGYDRA